MSCGRVEMGADDCERWIFMAAEFKSAWGEKVGNIARGGSVSCRGGGSAEPEACSAAFVVVGINRRSWCMAEDDQEWIEATCGSRCRALFFLVCGCGEEGQAGKA
jgi:hypothetical protein